MLSATRSILRVRIGSAPGDYGLVTDEELIEGLSFSAYHRISTVMFVPAQSGSAIEMVTIDPLDLQAAIDRDARERIDNRPLSQAQSEVDAKKGAPRSKARALKSKGIRP